MVGVGAYSVSTAVSDIFIAYYTVPAVGGVCVASGISVRGKTEQFRVLWLLSHSFSS